MGSFSTQTDVNSQSAKEILNTEYIRTFDVVATGTITTTAQYPLTSQISKLTNSYRNYVLVYNNKSGQTVNSVNIYGVTKSNNFPIPNLVSGSIIVLKQITINNGGAVDLTSEEPNPFIMGDMKAQFNLSGVPTSGTIDWALIGY